MISDDVLDLICCAKTHKCNKTSEKKCITCEISYRHLAENAMQLKCGHVVCESCANIDNYCHEHGLSMKISKNAKAYHVNYLLEKRIKEVFTIVRNNFETVIKFYESNFSNIF